MSSSVAARSRHSRCHVEAAPRSAARRPRKQQLSAAEILTLCVIAALLIAGTWSARPHSASVSDMRPIRVEAGDTLWSIARTHPIEGLTTAQAAELIARRNGTAGSALVVGRTLLVPTTVRYDGSLASR